MGSASSFCLFFSFFLCLGGVAKACCEDSVFGSGCRFLSFFDLFFSLLAGTPSTHSVSTASAVCGVSSASSAGRWAFLDFRDLFSFLAPPSPSPFTVVTAGTAAPATGVTRVSSWSTWLLDFLCFRSAPSARSAVSRCLFLDFSCLDFLLGLSTTAGCASTTVDDMASICYAHKYGD